MLYKKKYKIAILIIWLLVVITSLTAYFANSEFFKPESLLVFFKKYETGFLIIFLIISIVRGFTLIPSTPFVIAGALLFPDYLIAVLAISMIGIIISATLIYYFSDFMEFDKFFIRKYPKKIGWIKEKLDKKIGFMFVIAWSFFPAVPTDLVCYVAGTVKMKFIKYILAVFVGELPLVAFYIFGVEKLVSVL